MGTHRKRTERTLGFYAIGVGCVGSKWPTHMSLAVHAARRVCEVPRHRTRHVCVGAASWDCMHATGGMGSER